MQIPDASEEFSKSVLFLNKLKSADSGSESDPSTNKDTKLGVTNDKSFPKLFAEHDITRSSLRKSITEMLATPIRDLPERRSRDERYPIEYAASRLTDVKQVKMVVENIVGDADLSEDGFQNLQSQFLAQMGATLNLRSSVSTDRRLTRDSLLDIAEMDSAHGSAIWTRKVASQEVIKCRPFTPPEPARSVPSHVIRVSPATPSTKGKVGEMRENLTSLLRSRSARLNRERASISKKQIRTLKMEKRLEDVDQLNKIGRRQQLENTMLAEVARARADWNATGAKELRADVRVIVVGSGLAGLSAAADLLKRGFRDITVLEASDRVGGRLHSVCLPDRSDDDIDSPETRLPRDRPVVTTVHHAELGAPAWVPEDSSHLVFALARDQGLINWKREIARPQCRVIRADGLQLHERFVSSALRFCAHLERDIQILAASQHGRSSLAYSDYARVRRRHLLAGMGKSEERDLALAVDSISTIWRFASGDSHGDKAADLRGQYATDITAPHDVEIPPEKTSPSLKSFRKFSLGLTMENKNSVRKFPMANTSHLCASLMQGFPPDMVKHGCQVVHVDWSQFCSGCLHKGTVPEIKVVCANGKVLRADHVIMAVPLGHLKKFAGSMFEPALPESKLAAIEKIGVGTVSKIILHYSEPPWRAPFHLVWAGRRSGDARYDADSLLSRCLQISTSPDMLRIVEITFLNDIPPAAATDDAHVANEVSIILDRLLLTSSMIRKGCEFVPPPDKIVRSSWGRDPLFLGSHPYLRPGCDDDEPARIASPLTFRKRPVLQFAGDHTWSDFSRLTHGARASGLREAKRLTNFYNPYFGYENINPSFCEQHYV